MKASHTVLKKLCLESATLRACAACAASAYAAAYRCHALCFKAWQAGWLRA